MKKQVMKLSVISMLVLGGISAAQAGTSSEVNVSGVVNQVTCQLSVDKPDLSLVPMIPTNFKAADTLYNGEQVTATLTNCGTATTGASAGIQVTGPTISAGNKYFGSDKSANWGFGVTADGSTTLLANGDMLATANAQPATSLEKGYIAHIGFVAPSTTVSASPEQKAAITFAFVNP